MASLEGQRLGRYELLASIGRGGMAEVYRARDTKLGRDVAVKLVLPSYGEPEFIERFLREARLVASLEHPHILPVYDFGEDQGRPFLVVPLVDGGSLENRLGRGVVSLAKVSEWIRALAGALDFAHARGVLHRDVKPANVLLADGDRPFLSDFGIAKAGDATSKLTATGVVLGTPSYMAPELALGRPAGAASDIYALAVMAYELLAGGPPFSGDSALAVLHQHAHTPPPRLSLRAGHLPPAVDRVFDRALAKDPAARHGTAMEFATELAAALQLRSTDATTRLASTKVVMVSDRKAGSSGLRWVGIVAICALLALAGVWAFRRGSEPPPPPAQPSPPAATPSAVEPAGSGATVPTAEPAPVAAVPAGIPPSQPSTPVPSRVVAPPAPSDSVPSSTEGGEEGEQAEKGVEASANFDGRPQLLGNSPRSRPNLRRFGREDFQRMAQRTPVGRGRMAAANASRTMVEYGRGGLRYLDGDMPGARSSLDAIRSLPPQGLEPPGIAILRSLSGTLADWQVALAYGQAADAARLLEPELVAGNVTLDTLSGAGRAIRNLGEGQVLRQVVDRACAGGAQVACDFARNPF
jgi:serine/threonine protein kinase